MQQWAKKTVAIVLVPTLLGCSGGCWSCFAPMRIEPSLLAHQGVLPTISRDTFGRTKGLTVTDIQGVIVGTNVAKDLLEQVGSI